MTGIILFLYFIQRVTCNSKNKITLQDETGKYKTEPMGNI